MSTPEKEVARLDYCIRIYDRENERSRALENKARFYLSFGTLLLGAVFVRFESVGDVHRILEAAGAPTWIWETVRLSLRLLLAMIASSIALIFAAMWIRTHRAPYPRNPARSLFDENSPFAITEDYFEDIALSYAAALEHNARRNDAKATLLILASMATAVSVLLALVISTLVVNVQ